MSSKEATASNVEERSGQSSGEVGAREAEYFGWVYHLGVNSIGHEYCHLRFLFLRGTRFFMFKRDPHDHPGIKPIRKGVISHTHMVEELGRKKVNHGDLYVLRLYNRFDETKKGEIACATAGEARKWMEAFEQAKQQVEYDFLRGSGRHKLNMDTELNLEGHRPRVRRYANGLKKLIRIGKGPENLIRRSSNLGSSLTNTYPEGDVGDAIEAHKWRCIRTIHGIRIFEDVASAKSGKVSLLKSVGVVDASLDTVFEMVLSLDKSKRYEWDVLTGDLELIDSVNGHCDVVYGTYDPKFLPWWNLKKDFVFSRQWFRGQDGAYTILQFPAVHKQRPPKSGYQRTKMNCLREYFGANPALKLDSPSASISDASSACAEFEDSELKDEFYDAITNGDSLEDEDSEEDAESPKTGRLKLKNVSWAIAMLAVKRSSALVEDTELDANFSPASMDPNQFRGSLHQGKGETDTNCWTAPSGQGFMIRGSTYLKDYSKVMGGDPLLKLLAVDWLKAENSIDKVALHPNYLVQSELGKKLPFVLIINLQIPAKPNYNLVLYYGAERPIKKGSLLSKFVDGTDMFRDARFKLIPSIIEGYWMVKRAVGTKACLLGKAVTCRYLRQDNFLEIDVDIGSSSVARSIISLVLGYVTSIVVDLAILIEGKEESELPEYILGTVRLNRVRLDSAMSI